MTEEFKPPCKGIIVGPRKDGTLTFCNLNGEARLEISSSRNHFHVSITNYAYPSREELTVLRDKINEFLDSNQ